MGELGDVGLQLLHFLVLGETGENLLLDLADALLGQVVDLAYFLQAQSILIVQTEAVSRVFN